MSVASETFATSRTYTLRPGTSGMLSNTFGSRTMALVGVSGMAPWT
jgi:hypothetical protein